MHGSVLDGLSDFLPTCFLVSTLARVLPAQKTSANMSVNQAGSKIAERLILISTES